MFVRKCKARTAASRLAVARAAEPDRRVGIVQYEQPHRCLSAAGTLRPAGAAKATCDSLTDARVAGETQSAFLGARHRPLGPSKAAKPHR
jgi:hypothetical protein